MAVEKTLLYPDGRQRFAHLGLVDSMGCFCLMLDDNETVRLRFHGEAEAIGELSDRIAALEERAEFLRKRNAETALLVQDMYEKVARKNRGIFARRMRSLGIVPLVEEAGR